MITPSWYFRIEDSSHDCLTHHISGYKLWTTTCLTVTMVAFFFKIWQISICETRSIQSGEKECADHSGRTGRGHLVLVCAERRRPHPLLTVNRQRERPAAQIGVAKSDFSHMCRSRSRFNWERGAFHLDWSRFVRFWKRTQPILVCSVRFSGWISLLLTFKW